MLFKNQGQRCPYCANEHRNDYRKLTLEFIKEQLGKEGYTLLTTKYENAHQKLEVICPHGHKTNTMTWNNFQQNKRCSKCSESKGEKRIMSYLDDNNILYIIQYKFEDCKFKRVLPFDFYLPDYNICIEYDGELHYKIKKNRGGFDGFVNGIIRDTIKNEYCKNNNIKLIRIPYWKFDEIEKILELELK